MTVLDQFKLNNKLAFITGGGGLLGQEHAEAILEAGASVVLADINKKALDKAKQRFDTYSENLMTLECDITNEDAIKNSLEKINDRFNQYPNILINNATIDPKFEQKQTKQTRLENFPLNSWNSEISVGLTGAFLCSKHIGAKMAESKEGGIILNIASDLGLIAPDQRLYTQDNLKADEQAVKPITYSVIKHGLIGLTKYLATYWREENIRCNAFAPGGVYNDHPQEFADKLSELIPMGRMANLSEYKASIVFLCSQASSYMNGATLVIDGGRSTW